MISFETIMTRSIVYFDKIYKDECKAFCRLRHINYLPAIHDARVCYQFDGKQGRFSPREILPEQRVEPEETIFQTGIISRFKEYQILFVKSHGNMLGVVHYSDYNHPSVYEDTYKQLYQLERGLVGLLTRYSGLSCRSLAHFLGEDPAKTPDRLLSKGDFLKRKLSLHQIMDFAEKTKTLQISRKDRINLLRNKIAHSHDLVKKEHYQESVLNFCFDSFRKLVEGRQALEIALRQVSNRLYFMEASMEENFGLDAYPVFQSALR